MDNIDGKILTFIGRPSWPRSADVYVRLATAGAVIRRGFTRRTDLLVVGRGAYRLLDNGRLEEKLGQADRYGTRCLSEGGLLRLLGLSPPPAPAAAVSLDSVIVQTGLDRATLRLLALFDLMASEQDGLGFRDLVTAREVARLFGDGISLAEIVYGTSRLGPDLDESGVDQPLARFKFVATGEGDLALRFGGGVAEFSGQMRMALPASENPSVEALFEAAEAAEVAGDLCEAETLYNRCVDLDKRDPTARFNLANVLRNQARDVEAAQHLRLAVSIDSRFSDAWYNLAGLAEAKGDLGEAKACLLKALEADPSYADAIFNLASLYFRDGDFEAAMRGWQRYVTLDRDSVWSRKAREGLLLCREHIRQSGAA